MASSEGGSCQAAFEKTRQEFPDFSTPRAEKIREFSGKMEEGPEKKWEFSGKMKEGPEKHREKLFLGCS